jgi:SEL1 protein
MLLKGEGTAQDNATAIMWYEKAAASKNVRALNGLGYIHFYGTANVTQNQTKALAFFEQAAAVNTDGDSLFNAGFCYFQGLGTNVNRSHAIQAFYEPAARQFGHFDAMFALGNYWLHPQVQEAKANQHHTQHPYHVRNPSVAITYLKAVSLVGPWGKQVRRGFDAYLRGNIDSALWRYHYALELGYTMCIRHF